MVSSFRNDQQVVALLGSTRVASEGLTLIEANHAIFLNEWWNPSANMQARDRVVRIGQKKAVHVYTFRCIGTVEEALDNILAQKRSLTQDLVERLSQRSTKTASIDAMSREFWAEVIEIARE